MFKKNKKLMLIILNAVDCMGTSRRAEDSITTLHQTIQMTGASRFNSWKTRLEKVVCVRTALVALNDLIHLSLIW